MALVDVATLGIEVVSDAVDKAKARLNAMVNAGGNAEAWTKRFTSLTQRMNSAVQATVGRFDALRRQIFSLKGLIAGLGIGLVAKSFLDAARETENYQVRLKTLLGSVALGNELFKELSDLASRVPFEYRDIMNAGTTLSTVIRTNVQDIALWTEVTADLAAAFGMSIEDTAQNMVKALSAGASAADTFRERGVNAFLGFKAGVAVTAEETRKRILEEWQKTGSSFRGATLDMAKTWDGITSMISDKWFQLRVSIMNNGPFEFLKAGMQELDETFGTSFDKIDEHGKRISDTLMRVVESTILGFADVYDTLSPLFKAIGSVVKNFFDIYNSLPQWAQEIGIMGAILLGPTKAALIFGAIAALDMAADKMAELTDKTLAKWEAPQWLRDFMASPTNALGLTGDEGSIDIPMGSMFGGAEAEVESMRSRVEGVLERIRVRVAQNRAEAEAAEAAAAGLGIPGTGGGGVTSDAQKRIAELQREQEELTLLAAAHRMGAKAIEDANDAILVQKELLDAKVDLTSVEGQEILRLVVANEELRRSIEDLVEAEKNHNKAVDEINKRLTDLFPTFENLRREADLWRTEALAGLDATKAGYAEFAADVERIYAEQIRKARREDLDNSKEWSDGITRALMDYVEEASDGAAQMENVTRNALGGMEDAFAKWASTGKASARDMVTSILADLARLSFQQGVTVPILGALGFAAHSGAVVGSGGAARQMSMAAFATAQRYHSGGMPGLGPNEVPIIAERGEEVITRADPRHRFNGGGGGATFNSMVTVNVNGGAGGGGAQTDNTAMGEEIASLVSRAVQAEMAEFVRQQMRPGNMLNPSGGQSYGY